MPFDPASIGPEARALYIDIGESFGTDDVLNQLRVSIQAAIKYGSQLLPYGWPASQTQKMQDVADLVAGASAERMGAKADKKTTNAALLSAVAAAKNARNAVRTALTTARIELFERSNLELVNQIDSALAVTNGSGADPKLLAAQLATLTGLITNASVAEALTEAAAPLQTSINTAAAALDLALKAKGRPHGTPAQTEHLNLLEGLAVVMLRTVRKAGRSASGPLGSPELADAFQLNELYKTRSRRAGDDEEEPPTPVTP